MTFLSNLFQFAIYMSSKHNIDESHSISHSMNVLAYAHKIYEVEINLHPILKSHYGIISASAILHDMCDKKYMNEAEGLSEISEFLKDHMSPLDIDVTKHIISTMSYSKVKKNGYPNLGCYQYAYHVVREADLLTAYDFDRCMIYNMYKLGGTLDDAYENANELFGNRVLKHIDDGLFTTAYAKVEATKLHTSAVDRMNHWQNMRRLIK